MQEGLKEVFNVDFTYEECLGKQVFVKVFVDEDQVDHDTEVWIIAK